MHVWIDRVDHFKETQWRIIEPKLNFSYQSNKKTIEGWSRFSRRRCCCILEIQIAMYTSINDGKKIFLHKNLFDVIFDMWLDNKDDDEGRRKKIWIIIGWKIYWKKREELRNLMPDIFIIWSNLLLQNIFKIYFANFILGCHHHFDVLIVNVKHITKELQGFFLFAKKKKYERNLLSRVFFI